MIITRYTVLAIVIVIGVLSVGCVFSAGTEGKPNREALKKAFEAGNFKEAYEGYRALALDPKDDPNLVGDDLGFAVEGLRRLGRVEEIDEFRERVVTTHADKIRLARAAAENLLAVDNYGFLVAGKFERGNKRGGGEFVRSDDRDRARALQVLVHVLDKARAEPDRTEAGGFYVTLANTLLRGNRGSIEGWRLQALTDLARLPDYQPGWDAGGAAPGAPVDEEGTPVYHHVPKSFEDAKSDGERWRWALAQAAEAGPAFLSTTRMQLAGFCHQQFGVQTLASSGFAFGGLSGDKPTETGPFALHTLGEDETIARLATGTKRFKLPDEFNPIQIFREVAASDGDADNAFQSLAQIFEDRQQYDKAADAWRSSLRFPGNKDDKQRRLDQIVGRWGRFEPTMTQPSGRGAELEFRFRNGARVEFEAHEVLVPKLLDDVKAYVKSAPKQLDWQKIDLSHIGYRLVDQNEVKYVGRRVATWGLDLKPRPDHFDARVSVATPLQKPGAYLVTAKLADGNTSRVVVWVADTVILKKPLANSTFYYVADAVTGRPVAHATVEFFGFKMEHVKDAQFRIDTRDSAAFTDPDGQAVLAKEPGGFQWVAIATTKEGRFAHLGFSNVWHSGAYDQQYDQEKVYTITDRPAYRPKGTVKFKVWVRHARYDQDDLSEFAGKTFPTEVLNPKGEKVFEKSFQADAYGGFDGDLPLPADAALGVYQVLVHLPSGARQGGSFRVEEYKKPEFEVTVDAPAGPVMLGEKFKADIRARYYFGTPVTQAKVKYKVLRTAYTEQWYPPGAWDWLYGPGYWWFAHDYEWYPGWSRWGCRRPIAWWWGSQQQPPEIVAEAEVSIGADGTVAVEIDTAAAKALHGDRDHKYQIVAEVVDQSRRTIVGTGAVTVAREPFKVFAWVDRGYYRAGDTIRARAAVRTPDHKPVRGKGTLRLLKVDYDANGKAAEAPVQTWDDVETDADGQTLVQVKAAEAGQYRLSFQFTDEKGRAAEGGYVLTVTGPGFDGAGFRFNDIELVADKREYQPGEKVRLLVNADRSGGTVLLFLRPANGVYLPPKVLRLKGKSVVEEVEIVQKDMPNVFVEAVTIANGKVHSDVKEIVVPPEKRILNVEVTPSGSRFKPGQKAGVKVRLTDSAGKPFVGSTVVAMYDKAVEYIAGGSNVEEIRAFFWKWRRAHHPNSESSLDRASPNLPKSGEVVMADLGVFGNTFLGSDGFAEDDRRGKFEVTRGRVHGLGMLKSARGMTRSENSKSDASAPMSAPMALGAAPAGAIALGAQGIPESDPQGAPVVAPTVRTNFADTAFWVGALTTGADGTAEVAVDLPESLTTWKVKTWALGHGTRVGQGEAEVVTAKDLLVRLQAPRFFVQKDEVVLSANVHNALDHKKSVQVVLELDGGCLKALGAATQVVAIDAKGEARVDWRVQVVREGEAVVRMKALTDEESDAMEMRFPAYVHGMLKTESWAGALRPDAERASITVRVPDERRPEQTRLEVRYSPTLAGAMVDALPYLVDYPYGCTEQTLNRFLPTVITRNVLREMGLDLKAIREKRTNLNAQEVGDPAERARGWKRFPRNPVFDEAEVRDMVKDGLQRLGDMQVTDGGWGWFSGWGERSYPHTTALVVHGLQTARRNDVALVPGVMERGVAWLKTYQDEQVRLLKNAPSRTNPSKQKADNLDAFVDMVLVDGGVKSPDMLDFLYRDRTELAVSAQAMFGLALDARGEKAKRTMVLENISQFVVRDDENQTSYLKMPDANSWWHWYGSEPEAHGYYLKLLARTDPKGETAARLVKYLVNNRKHATYWDSTRDTAICIEALAEHLKASGESRPDLSVEVLVDGKSRKQVRITPSNLFTFDSTLVLAGDALEGGAHQVEFRKTGRGPLYFNAYLTNFTLEDPIARAGLEVKVGRTVYKLVKEGKSADVAGARGQVVGQKVEAYRREPLADGAVLKSGDLVEVELEIDSKNDYEYLIFEDLKAAGFEPVDVRSGYNGNSLGAYMELRDERVSFFVRALARGRHSVAYRLRAETPGVFSALPARAAAMYAPELRGNSDELKLTIED